MSAEDLAFARIHRKDLIAMPTQVIADEIARAQFVRRQSDDRNGFRAVEHPLNGQRILIACEVERADRAGWDGCHTVATPLAAAVAARENPCSRSQIKSSTDSVPTDNRMVPGPTPAARSSSSFN